MKVDTKNPHDEAPQACTIVANLTIARGTALPRRAADMLGSSFTFGTNQWSKMFHTASPALPYGARFTPSIRPRISKQSSGIGRRA